VVFAFFAGGGAVKFVKDYDAAGLKQDVPLMGSGFLTDGTLEAQGASGAGPADHAALRRRHRHAAQQRLPQQVRHHLQAAARRLCGAGLRRGADAGRRPERGEGRLQQARRRMLAAMRKATIDSPRGKYTLSRRHNPVQDFYIREVKGRENVMTGIAVKVLADPARGCKM
jgi:branched-chain amino acid transport system substrate-binding protein